MLQVGVFLLLWRISFGQHITDEAIYTINGKKALHTVSEKFVSFSIDPAVLLTGLNLSDVTLQMAKHLSPAYVRIAGPSTQFIKYQEESWNDVENGFVVVTPTMWFGINEWLASANLTPVFGINDAEAGKEGWNPQDAMEVLHVADKFNVSCYWQLGFDCANKTDRQYESDLSRLQHVLDAFPDRKDQWKIVGSDLTRCVADPRKVLDDLGDVLAAVVLEQEPRQSLLKSKVPLWTTSPKCPRPVSFAAALSWAQQTGEAAKNGYQVLLRQPRLHEIFSETPPFWVSLFHKLLMGRNVLDVKPTIGHPQLYVYAHCTKHQNDFSRGGAMTVLVVNNCTTNDTLLLRLGTVLLKNTEVQSYILTAESEDATEVYLNGEKLSLGRFDGDKLDILPKFRRAKIMNYLSLFLPPKSVGFFVLPDAQIPICATEEPDLKLLMEEIREDQNIPFSDEEISVEVTPRFALHKSPTLRELQEVMEKELASDERFYKKKKKKNHEEIDGRNFFIQRAKYRQSEDTKRPEELKRTDLRHRQHKEEEPKKIFELELTSTEIRKVLADRAKAKAAKKNIIFTSQELEDLMDKATHKFLNNKNTAIRIKKKTKREVTRDKKDINMRLLKLKTFGDRRKLLKNKKTKPAPPVQREKRDINMELLKLKTEMLHNSNKPKKTKTKFENNEEKQATIREPGETSAELTPFEDLEEEEEEESPLPDTDVFAELADPNELFFTTTEKAKIGLKTKNLFHLRKPVLPRIEVQPIKYKPEDRAVLEADFEVNSGPAEDDGGNFACIHEFFAKNVDEVKDIKNSSELWELGFEDIEEKTNNHLPAFANRVKEVDEGILDEYFEDGKDVYVENDYEDLESDESSPVRLKRKAKWTNDDKFYYNLGKGYDPAKIKIDDGLKDQQFKFLKERLVQKKKFDFFNKNNELMNKRIIRSLLGKKEPTNRYKSLTDGLKIWKPADILTLKNTNKKKTKRSVDHDLDSVENEIGEFMKEVMKDTKIIHSQLDTENGDYQLVFPNKDKIEVVENQGETELKLVLHGDGTCPSTGKEQETTKSSNIQKITKKKKNVWDQLFRKVSQFFQGLSSKVKKYIIDDLIK